MFERALQHDRVDLHRLAQCDQHTRFKPEEDIPETPSGYSGGRIATRRRYRLDKSHR